MSWSLAHAVATSPIRHLLQKRGRQVLCTSVKMGSGRAFTAFKSQPHLHQASRWALAWQVVLPTLGRDPVRPCAGPQDC